MLGRSASKTQIRIIPAQSLFPISPGVLYPRCSHQKEMATKKDDRKVCQKWRMLTSNLGFGDCCDDCGSSTAVSSMAGCKNCETKCQRGWLHLVSGGEGQRSNLSRSCCTTGSTATHTRQRPGGRPNFTNTFGILPHYRIALLFWGRLYRIPICLVFFLADGAIQS